MNNVWRIGSKWGDDSISSIFKEYEIAFCGDEIQNVNSEDIVAITEGQRIIGVGQVSKLKPLSQINSTLATDYGDRLAITFSSLFWNCNADFRYGGQGKQFHQAGGEYATLIKNLFATTYAVSATNKMKTQILQLLLSNHQLILTGAPGTGKTYLAREIAKEMSTDKDGNSHWDFCQFHPSYDYSDFVEGIRPTGIQNGHLVFTLLPGAFKAFCAKAADDPNPDHKHVFVIDEINRADLSRVFGELFFAIESGYRGEDVPTQYSSFDRSTNPQYKTFRVPKSVYIIGTMNDIDRSVESLDFALRRRFAWFEIKADDSCFYRVMKDIFSDNNALLSEARQRYESLNTEIEQTAGLSSAYQIGPAYFLNLKKYLNEKDMWACLWDYHLEQLIKEYLRGMTKWKGILDKLKGAYDLSQDTSKA